MRRTSDQACYAVSAAESWRGSQPRSPACRCFSAMCWSKQRCLHQPGRLKVQKLDYSPEDRSPQDPSQVWAPPPGPGEFGQFPGETSQFQLGPQDARGGCRPRASSIFARRVRAPITTDILVNLEPPSCFKPNKNLRWGRGRGCCALSPRTLNPEP